MPLLSLIKPVSCDRQVVSGDLQVMESTSSLDREADEDFGLFIDPGIMVIPSPGSRYPERRSVRVAYRSITGRIVERLLVSTRIRVPYGWLRQDRTCRN